LLLSPRLETEYALRVAAAVVVAERGSEIAGAGCEILVGIGNGGGVVVGGEEGGVGVGDKEECGNR